MGGVLLIPLIRGRRIVNVYIETEEYYKYPNSEVKRCIRMSEDIDYLQIVSNNINGIIER